MSTRRPLAIELLVAGVLGVLVAAGTGCGPGDLGGSPHRVYVMLGFHGNFYHSWRGDTPDEAGFGTDIRMVRAILKMLDEANAHGLDARGYWDFDNQFSLERIIPAHAPDILRGLQRRIEDGRDEIILAPYDNGMLSAMTADEVRAALRLAISNPRGSGVADLFPSYFPILRPNEGMATPGLIPLLREAGIEGIVLAYSSYPFNTLSTFVEPLPPEQLYNPTRLRLRPDGPSIVLWPCASIGDVLNHISLERWLIDLRRLQVSGAVDRDLVIHINFDADAESWLPVDLPPLLDRMPNSGGLVEYIAAVNKYDWAAFTTPGRYAADHDPVGELTVREDLADGPGDGQYAWAEKLSSHGIWTRLEQSRLASGWAEAWLADASSGLARRVRGRLWRDDGSSFARRLELLSTTHFGMSTPTINEERQAAAERLAAGALDTAESALRQAASPSLEDAPPRTADTLGRWLVRDGRPPAGSGSEGAALGSLLRIPVRIPTPFPDARLEDGSGRELPYSLVDVARHGDASAGELLVRLSLRPGEVRALRWRARPGATAPAPAPPPPTTDLDNGRIHLGLDGQHGVTDLSLDGRRLGDAGFLTPFVGYRTDAGPHVFGAGSWTRGDLSGERWQGVQRARLETAIPVETPGGGASVRLRVDFTLPDDADFVVADVDVRYPYTEKRDLVSTPQKKLRRAIDLRWLEVAPFELHPLLEATRAAPIEVWRRNYLGVTASYLLDYGRINPRNAELDTFNHQITADFVAVGDGRQGLLLAQAADVRSSHAFAPMRLRERDGHQQLAVNPFGSYYSERFSDYSHVTPIQIGTEFMLIGGSQFASNAPSYNGAHERFSLLIAPFTGSAPPEALRVGAERFFRPPSVVEVEEDADAPGGRRVLLPSRVRRQIDADAARAAAAQASGPPPVPRAFLVNPTVGAVDVVWDPPSDPRVDGYEIDRRAPGGDWQRVSVGPASRQRIDGLTDGTMLAFRMRAMAGGVAGVWTPEQTVEIGAVPPGDITGIAGQAPLGLLLRTFGWGLVHIFTTR